MFSPIRATRSTRSVLELVDRVRALLLDGVDDLLGEAEELVVLGHRLRLAAHGDDGAVGVLDPGDDAALGDLAARPVSPRRRGPSPAGAGRPSRGRLPSRRARACASIIAAPVMSRSSLTWEAEISVIRPAPPPPPARRRSASVAGLPRPAGFGTAPASGSRLLGERFVPRAGRSSARSSRRPSPSACRPRCRSQSRG